MPIYRAAVGATTRMTVDAWLAAVPMISPADWIVPSGVKEQQVSDAHTRACAHTRAHALAGARGGAGGRVFVPLRRSVPVLFVCCGDSLVAVLWYCRTEALH